MIPKCILFISMLAKASAISITHPVLGDINIMCHRRGFLNARVFVEINQTYWSAMAQAGPFKLYVDIPDGCPPYKQLFISREVGGVHPPWDGRQFGGQLPGGFGQPHVDIHFLMVDKPYNSMLNECTPNPQNPNVQCDILATDSKTQSFLKLPSTEYISGFLPDMRFGGAAILGHGHHLLTVADMTKGGPAHCTDPWIDCHMQMLEVIALGKSFSDRNCMCGFWEDGSAPVMITHNGSVIGHEVMPTIGLLDSMKSKNLTIFREAYPLQKKYERRGYIPTDTFTELTATTIRVGLDLKAADADSIIYLFFVILLGTLVPVSYAMIIYNVSGLFPVESTSSYLNSPYWLSIPKGVRKWLVPLQLLAACGYIAHHIWIASNLQTLTTFFRNRWLLVFNPIVLIVTSSLWPLATYYAITRPRKFTPVVIACIALWSTAACGILNLVGTVMEYAPWYIVLGNTMFCIVVVLADGIGWAWVCISEYMKHSF